MPLAIIRNANPVVIISLLFRYHFSKTSRYIPDCCYALQIHPMLTCDAVRVMSAFSSCKDLLKDKALAVVVWIIITLSVAGNLSSIFIGATLRERDRTQRLLITNLGVSDLLNGVYLLIIAINDRRWAGQYFNKDIEWRSSFLCNLTGFLSMLSIQVSVFTLTAISTIRCIAVFSPLSFRGLTVTTTVATLAATWCVGIFLSVAPFLDDSYFKKNSEGFFGGNSVGFFGGNSVCLPLQLPGERLNGWEYGLAIFGFLNILLCLYLATAYVVLFYSLRRTRVCPASAEIANEQSALVKRLFVVVLTNLFCLFPVGLLMYLSLAGRIVNPQRAVYAWFAVCVMSLNSAFNPLLYTFTTHKVVKILKQTAVKIYGFCRTESSK